MSRAERQLTPDKSPQDRFGYELRAWRKARGLTQVQLAKVVHVSDDTIQKIEVAERPASRDLVEHCDAALDAAGALLRQWDFAEKQETDTDSTPTQTDNPTVGFGVTPPKLITPTDDDMMVMWMTTLEGERLPVMINRRAFVTSMAAIPAAGWLAGAAEGTPLTAPLPGGDLADVLGSMAELRTALTTQDNVLGPRTVVPTALHQITILQELTAGARGTVRQSVMNLQAAYAEFTGWLADDLGDRKAGQYWIDRALEWGHEGDDDLIIGYILARKAQRASEEGNHAAAVGLAKASQRSGGLSSRVLAAATLYEAQGHAASGHGDANEFRAAIDQSREILTAITVPPGPGDWAAWCTQGYLAMHEANGWMQLSQPAKAVSVYEQGLVNWPTDMRRDQGLYFGRLAHALAEAGQPDEAASVGRTALEIASRTGSARIVSQLKMLPAILSKDCDGDAVRTFVTDLGEHLKHRMVS